MTLPDPDPILNDGLQRVQYLEMLRQLRANLIAMREVQMSSPLTGLDRENLFSQCQDTALLIERLCGKYPFQQAS